MSSHEIPKTSLEDKLDSLQQITWAIAQEYKGDSLSLLAVLRVLEQVHQEIRDSLFQQSLPDNRQSLYKLLRDIETKGGWPYIYRMRLQSIMEKLELPEEPTGMNFDPPNSSLADHIEPFD
jgi:hypothetical protein